MKPGGRFGRYRIVRELGSGGMGEVYLAEDTQLNRQVALKFPGRGVAAGAGNGSEGPAVQGLLHEARAAAALNHPNICTVHEVGEIDGRAFIAMEHVEGVTLAEMIGTDGLPPDTVIRYGERIAAALQHAHERGVVHRDLKPANVMVGEEGRVKVLDFGLATLSARSLEEISESQATVAELEPGGGGTLHYLAPELLRGEPASVASDVWSLGVLLYEAASGRLPFEGATGYELTTAILRDAPESLPDRVPGALRAVVGRCLEKEPGRRYRSCGEVRSALETIRSDPALLGGGAARAGPAAPGGERPSTVLRLPRSRTARVATAVAVVLGAVLLAAVLLLDPGGVLGAAAGWLGLGAGDAPAASTASDRTPAAGEAAEEVIAVLPFTVQGSDEVAYLGDGMVDLLGTTFDGAGSLRSVDARAVLGATGRGGAGAADIDPSQAARIADRLGADLLVLGNIVEVGGRLHLQASLYSSDSPDTALARASVEGTVADVFELVDEVAARLLAGRTRGPGARLTRTALLTTSSLPALKSYLEGERHFRAGRYREAVDSFRDAVADDPEFALAHYRLSIVAEWITDMELAADAAARAMELSDRLSPRDALILEASLLNRRGASSRAEDLYRRIVRQYPDDVEAWFQLAEVQFHYGPRHGRPVAESAPQFEKVLGFEPDHAPSLVHLARIDAAKSRHDDMSRRIERILELNPEGERAFEERALRAFLVGDEEQRRQVVELAEQTDDVALFVGTWSLGAFGRHVEGASRLVDGILAPSRGPRVRATGRAYAAHLEAARGRWSGARRHLASADIGASPDARALGAALWAAPFAPLTDAEVAARLEELRSWRPQPAPDVPASWFNPHGTAHAHVRLYLLGALSARLGDAAAVDGYAGRIERLDAPPEAGTLPLDLVRALRGHAARLRGDLEEAAELLSGLQMEHFYLRGQGSTIFAHALERFLLGDVLEQLGRDEEALFWFASLRDNSALELAFAAPAALRRARILERLGRPEEAAEQYRRVLELWDDADPELRPALDEVRRALR